MPRGSTIAAELDGPENSSARPRVGRAFDAGPSFGLRLRRWVERWSGRPTLFAVAAINVITGIAIGVVLGPDAFGADAGMYRACAQTAAAGVDCGFLYPPLMALAARPLTWVDPAVASAAMSLIGLSIVLLGVRLETRGHALVDRALVLVAALTFAPVVYELIVGQVTLLIAAAIYPAARRADAVWNGIPLGIALALAPKPLILPILFWMLIWRRRALGAALATAVGLTLVGVALVGLDQYREWFGVLTAAGRQATAGTFGLSLSGNYSLWPLTQWTLPLAVLVGVVALWMIPRDPARSFVVAVLASLLLAPYTGLYAASILLLAVRPALGFAPRATRVLALTANVGIALLFGLWAWGVAGVVACLPAPRRWPRADARLLGDLRPDR